MRTNRIGAGLCLLVGLLAACQQEAPSPPAPEPAPAPAKAKEKPHPEVSHKFKPEITAGDFAQHLLVVSSDDYEGRAPGTIGERLTTTYLKGELERIGLQPANDGSYFQRVPMQTTTIAPDTSVMIAVGERPLTYKHGEDIVVGTRLGKPAVGLSDAPLVFVGYGVDAPEQGWNDYAGIDVKGKVVVALVNDPGFLRHDPELFRGEAMTYYGRWTYKFEEAARKGAAGCLLIHDDAAAAYGWSVVVNSWATKRYDLPPAEDPDPRLTLQGWFSADGAKKLFEAEGIDLKELALRADQRGFKAMPLKAKLTAQLKSEIRNSDSNNVVGLIKGKEKPEEVVVYTAHWDHFGKHDDEPGDNIYNGAIDNGTGVAGVLEIAEAFAHQTPPPSRTVLFLFTTLEESSLLGSRYYVTHPLLPLDKTVAEINLDDLPIRGRTEDLTIIGKGHSDLDQLLATVAEGQQRRVIGEETPQDGFFFRSDHFNFARKGIPSLYARSGFSVRGKGESWGRANADDYVRTRYHKPADEFDPDWDLTGVIEDVTALYESGRRLATGDITPQWNADSEFAKARPAKK